MVARKQKEKTLAIKLRQKGLSYGEIREKVKVSKSTLNYWFKQEGLIYEPSHFEIQRLKRIEKFVNQNLGVLARKAKLEARKNEIVKVLLKQIEKFGSQRDLFIAGCVLYWAEGSKRGGIKLVNSDPLALKLFMRFLKRCLNVHRFIYNLYLHQNKVDMKEDLLRFWSRVLRIDKSAITVYLKKHVPKKKNYKKEYLGVFALKVPKSTLLGRALIEIARNYIAG